jgi:hypothetical protein
MMYNIRTMVVENPEARGFIPESISGSKLLDMRIALEERAAERIKNHLDKSIIVVQDTEEYERRRQLPLLFEIRKIDIGYDGIGNIYTPWYEPKEIEVEGKRRFLANPTGQVYKIISPKKAKEGLLDNLPKRRPVNELILGRTFLLEEAIRQQQHILEGYQPGTAALETDFARQVIAKTEEIAFRFLSQRRMSGEDLIRLAGETGSFLAELRLYEPRDPRKRKILEKFTSLSELDLTERHTYLGVLSRIFSAHAAATGRIIIGGLTTDKFFRNLQALVYLEGNYRWRFGLTARELEMVLGLPAFKNKSYTNRTEREKIARNLEFIVGENLSEIKVNPYLRAARWAEKNIVGCKEEEKEENTKIMGEFIAKEVFSRTPVTKLIVRGNFAEAEIRIRQSINQLKKPHFDNKNVKKA